MRIVAPSDRQNVTLRFEHGRVSSPEGFEAVNQFLGRYYANALMNTRPAMKDSFAKLGDVFWFDQHRNLGALMADDLKGDESYYGRATGEVVTEGWHAGVEQLREYLVGWCAFHTTP